MIDFDSDELIDLEQEFLRCKNFLIKHSSIINLISGEDDDLFVDFDMTNYNYVNTRSLSLAGCFYDD